MARRVMLIVAVLASAAAPANALAATITVNTTADAEAVDGLCSLREAIRAANTDTAPSSRAGECAAGSGADTIVLPAGTYKLAVTGPPEDNDARGDLDVRGPTTIDGAGADTTTIDASGAHDRALQILPGATATIQGVTITGGQAPDGADGTSAGGSAGAGAIAGPGDDGEPGGGIRNDGTLTVIDSVITHNVAGAGGAGGNGTGGAGDTSSNGSNGGQGIGGDGGAGGGGGGVFSDGAALTLTRTVLSGNSAGASGAGGRGVGGQGGAATMGNAGAGGIGGGGNGGFAGSGGAVGQQGMDGSVTILQSSITDNAAGAGGRGGDGDGGLGGGSGGNGGGAGGSGVSGLAGGGGNGGGIDAVGALVVSGDLISANNAGAGGNGGAGIGGLGGAAAGPNGIGGRGGDGTAIAGGVGGAGGGINAQSLSATNDTIVGNSTGAGGDAGAATGGDGGPILDAGTNGRGGDAFGGTGEEGGPGGGVSLVSVSSLLLHTTIADNALLQGGDGTLGDPGDPGTGGTGGTRGLGRNGPNGDRGVGGGVDGPAVLENSIVTGDALPSCARSQIDGGQNIAFPDTTCPGANVAPQLEPLGDNGGPTLTEALAPGSPALDAVPGAGAGCPATDQRDVTRPHGTACDIGAYEHAAPDVTTNPPTSVSNGGATLNGSVTPNGVHASYHFEYGKTTAYDSATIARTASGGATAATTVTAALTGLTPGTTYHYRLVATNADGTTAGADRTLTTSTTSGAPPGTGSGSGGAPRISSASVSPRVFAVKPTTRPRRTRAKSHAPFGTTFRYTLSEAARVTFTIERALPGRTSGRACRAPTRRTRRSRRCTRFVTPRVFAVNGSSGPNATTFSGRIRRTALTPGDDRASLVASDAAKRRSAPKRLTFRIIAHRRGQDHARPASP